MKVLVFFERRDTRGRKIPQPPDPIKGSRECGEASIYREKWPTSFFGYFLNITHTFFFLFKIDSYLKNNYQTNIVFSISQNDLFL